MNYIENSEKLINTAWSLFQEIPLGRSFLEQLSSLKLRLHQPCELAIAGKVKAGKSSFLNALIGEDLAKVGDLETTATINRFCYGKPENPSRPVKVVWDDGTSTYETREFMDSIQSYDSATLAKASRIEYLEFQIENPLLRELTLVDTPGTGAVVDEHQQIAEEYFALRNKHKEQTRKCTSKADAVVYLLGAVANVRDKGFLDDFRSNTEDGIPFNTVGILAKVDIDVKMLEERNEQAKYLADSLKDQLCTVLPVSAGLYKALKDKETVLEEWQQLLKKIPQKTFSMMMKSQALFSADALSDIPSESRREMKGKMPWSIFRTIANTLYTTTNTDDALRELYDIANIESVKHIINDYFFNRSRTIRCTRILKELYKLVQQVQSFGMFQLRDENLKIGRWIEFANHEADQLEGLNEYLKKRHLENEDLERLEAGLTYDLKAPIENLLLEIKQADEDFQTLQLLRNNKDLFSDEENEELNTLFGMYGPDKLTDIETINQRCNYWRCEVYFIRNNTKRQIVQNAINKYNHQLTHNRI